jgi:hypothetical protein
MPWLGFEPTIKAFERAKAVHVLEGVHTVIGWPEDYQRLLPQKYRYREKGCILEDLIPVLWNTFTKDNRIKLDVIKLKWYNKPLTNCNVIILSTEFKFAYISRHYIDKTQ